jgi:hypothetical protein
MDGDRFTSLSSFRPWPGHKMRAKNDDRHIVWPELDAVVNDHLIRFGPTSRHCKSALRKYLPGDAEKNGFAFEGGAIRYDILATCPLPAAT